MGYIEQLADRYKSYISLPWKDDLSGAERIIFVVYDKTKERRLRKGLDHFKTSHKWIDCDLTSAFAKWMADLDYKVSYFESPEDLVFKLNNDFLLHVANHIRDVLNSPDADANSIVGVCGIASLYGLIRVSDIMKEIEQDIKGRMVVFFPGQYENNNYRLLDARDGWNYLAVPITLGNDFGL